LHDRPKSVSLDILKNGKVQILVAVNRKGVDWLKTFADIEGVKCWGVKEGKNGLGIVVCKGKAAAVYTTNRIKAAPVLYNMSSLKGEIEGIIVNSGNANAFTGKKGLENAKMMAEMLADRLGCDSTKIAVASTGVIGRQLDMKLIEMMFNEVYPKLSAGREAAEAFATAIMTTDRFPKLYSAKAGDAVVAGVAKGAGMMAPNMATMLAFIFTDADFRPDELQEMLKEAADRSFNVTVVDGDTSTNDMVLLVSTGRRKVDRKTFYNALLDVCVNLAKMMARDGEGATKLMEVVVKGAKNSEEAFKAAKTVASSLLVKTAVFGNDPNWGRIIAALGYSGIEVDEDITLDFVSDGRTVRLLEKGVATGKEGEAGELMKKSSEIRIVVDLHKGGGEGYAFGCDLTYDYVRLNAEYTT
jgi:glutamate N-acetyltransferase/amino-acid N-acetyltransferase